MVAHWTVGAKTAILPVPVNVLEVSLQRQLLVQGSRWRGLTEEEGEANGKEQKAQKEIL